MLLALKAVVVPTSDVIGIGIGIGSVRSLTFE